MNVTEQRVLAALDMPGLLTFLDEIVSFASLDGTTAENAVQAHIANWMRQQGFHVDQWEIDFATLSQHPKFCWEVERQQGLGVVGSIGANQGGRSLIFNGHTDVVPAGDPARWQFPAWRATLDGGRVYGRGALDMKGGLACALFAAKALLDAGVPLQGRLQIQSVIGEEDGGCGTLATVLRGHTADAAIIIEPTELKIAPAQAGAQNFRLRVAGQAAHGCVREEGVSAIEKFIPLQTALLELEHQRNARLNDPLFARYTLPYALCIGRVSAGDWASTVAEALVAEGRYGVAVGEDVAAARRELEQAVAQAASADPWLRQHPPEVEWWGGQFDPAATPTDHPIVTTLAGAFSQVQGTAPVYEGMTYGADMRLLINVGQTPTVMFGPGDVRNAHRPDEFVPLADLEACARTLALTALHFCE